MIIEDENDHIFPLFDCDNNVTIVYLRYFLDSKNLLSQLQQGQGSSLVICHLHLTYMVHRHSHL